MYKIPVGQGGVNARLSVAPRIRDLAPIICIPTHGCYTLVCLRQQHLLVYVIAVSSRSNETTENSATHHVVSDLIAVVRSSSRPPASLDDRRTDGRTDGRTDDDAVKDVMMTATDVSVNTVTLQLTTVYNIMSGTHRRSQDVVWGCTFSPKS